jgi:hypothetical protein
MVLWAWPGNKAKTFSVEEHIISAPESQTISPHSEAAADLYIFWHSRNYTLRIRSQGWNSEPLFLYRCFASSVAKFEAKTTRQVETWWCLLHHNNAPHTHTHARKHTALSEQKWNYLRERNTIPSKNSDVFYGKKRTVSDPRYYIPPMLIYLKVHVHVPTIAKQWSSWSLYFCFQNWYDSE